MKVCTACVRTEIEKLCWLCTLGKLLKLNTGRNHRANWYQEFITRRIKRKTERWATSPGLQSCGSFVIVIDFSVSPESCFYFETQREKERERERQCRRENNHLSEKTRGTEKDEERQPSAQIHPKSNCMNSPLHSQRKTNRRWRVECANNHMM